MKSTVTWKQGLHFVGESESGFSIDLDGSSEDKVGASPMELILMSMGGCASIDVVHILKKGRADVQGCVTELQAERAETDPKVFVKVNMHFKVSGNDLTEKAVARAVELSAEKYCSASIMIGKCADVTHSFEIVG